MLPAGDFWSNFHQFTAADLTYGGRGGHVQVTQTQQELKWWSVVDVVKVEAASEVSGSVSRSEAYLGKIRRSSVRQLSDA